MEKEYVRFRVFGYNLNSPVILKRHVVQKTVFAVGIVPAIRLKRKLPMQEHYSISIFNKILC
jgi:hypothetical protein